MDDTQPNRTTDASATRKRRSSILKSQRPVRTPFSELEFNVATPTDTAKNRRVSFSRRTGVAEFATNEATTTWKNFYEEHNKSLESSGNDSAANPARQPVEHLGRRIFDQQFEEVEAVDLIGTLAPTLNTNGSFNNSNFKPQITSDFSIDAKLTAPNNKFELSALTDQQSNLFGNDFTVTDVGEMSGKIKFNFSNVQRIGEKDDLDEIEKDLERVSNNVVCPGPADLHNVSEYIEVDLNMTHVAKNDDCDMSITDTINSPKVQDVSKSSIGKRNNSDNDWMTDKENIAVNPYVTPLESNNFAVNDEPDQVLVFDGKRLTLQTEKSEKGFRQTLPHNTSSETPLRKTIVLNTNDDLPNFIDDVNLTDAESRPSTSYGERNLCVKAVHKVEIFKRDDNTGNISITQSLPTNIISGASENMIHNPRGNGTKNISVTESLNGQIFTSNIKPVERRRTVVYEDETGNISITQALPTNIIQNEHVDRRKTIVFDNDKGNLSITQALSSQFIADHAVADRRKTIIYEDDKANISITQALPSGVILDQKDQQKRKTIVFDDDSGNISITQALPANIVVESRHEKHKKTILYEDDTGNLSTDHVDPSNLTGSAEQKRAITYADDKENMKLENADLEENTQIFDAANISMTQVLPTNIILKDSDTNKRRTIVYDNDTGDISITEAISSQVINGIANKEDVAKPDDDSLKLPATVAVETDTKHRTIIYDTEAADVSMTRAIPANIIINDEEGKEKQHVDVNKEDVKTPDDNACDISLAEEVPANVFLLEGLIPECNVEIPVINEAEATVTKDIEKNTVESRDNEVQTEKRRTVVFSNEIANDDMSITQVVPAAQNITRGFDNTQVLDKHITNLSLRKPIPDQLIALHEDMINKTVEKDWNQSTQTSFCKQNINVVVYQTTTLESSQQVNLNNDKPSQYECGGVESKADKTDVTEIEVSKEREESEDVKNVIESNVVPVSVDATRKVTENPKNNETSVNFITISKDADVKESNASVLHVLLDMSDDAKSYVYNKYAETDVEPALIECEPEQENIPSMLSFDMTQDEKLQTDKLDSDSEEELSKQQSDTFKLIRDSSISTVDHKQQEESVQNPLALFMKKNNDVEEKPSPRALAIDEKENEKVHHRSFKQANDTQELLDMICDFTDNSRCLAKDDSISLLQDELPEKEIIAAKETHAVTNDVEIYEPRSVGFTKKRQSIMSREDLLNNISMAQAVLQKSRVEFDDTNLTDDNQESSPDEDRETQHRSTRLSNEVVKTLQFDDESLSESHNLMPELSNNWPLRKTVFNDTSYVKDKTKVIPSYLKDVSDGIKQLMSDLVKPMADAVPFDSQEQQWLKKKMSTISTQIQANLTTSSQIELSSLPWSQENLEDIPCYRSGTNSLRMVDSIETSSTTQDKDDISTEPSTTAQPPCRTQSFTEDVLVFDHNNPLNNILLGPIGYSPAHVYKPLSSPVPADNLRKQSDDTLCGSDRSTSCQINMEMDPPSTDSDIMKLGVQDVEMNTDNIVTTQYCVTIHGDHKELPLRKLSSLDRAVDVQCQLEDAQVNTVIAMKPNKDLLEKNSSLTLIDTISEAGSQAGSSHYTRKDRRTSNKGVVKFMPLPSIESDVTSTDDSAHRLVSKGKKRVHVPVTPSRRASIETTPKPSSKILKVSDHHNRNRIMLRMSHEPTKLPAERDTDGHEKPISPVVDKTIKKSPHRSFESTITIQQLITEYQIDAGMSKEMLEVLENNEHCKSGSGIRKVPSPAVSITSDSVDKVCSFTSSKNLGPRKQVQSVTSTATSRMSQSSIKSTECSRIDWRPELTSLSSTKNVSYFDSGVNIVSKIDMLPFMGSYECERESSPADTWSFRLLHGRIRLAIRLAHRHVNATRTRVRADTPVKDISIETIDYDKKNPVAILCIRFACETMRYMVSSGGENSYLARDVPALLRRCAAVARVALRWGRAMHDAKLHLAYTLDSDGHLTLKVANIRLRSVWEVSMDLELVVDHPSQAPWPRAGNVDVKRVVSDVPVSEDDVRRALQQTPNDWGHAPKTLWRIFKYLKNKQRDDDEVLLGV